MEREHVSGHSRDGYGERGGKRCCRRTGITHVYTQWKGAAPALFISGAGCIKGSAGQKRPFLMLFLC